MIFNEPPEYIWLQYHGDADPADYPNSSGPSADEVSWCWEPVFEHDIKYTKADRIAELEAELEQVRAERDEAKELCFECDRQFRRGMERAAEIAEVHEIGVGTYSTDVAAAIRAEITSGERNEKTD